MDSKKYVLHHDFGYGREPEIENIIKLNLRNYEDLLVYIADIIQKDFIKAKRRTVYFRSGLKTKVLVEKNQTKA
ncbi:MAG: hypothetical protein IJZ62_01240 [Clostridia bacterium]|nr:hypothetical protein [Clostridia bacterium]